jgi:beta-barrel assembly-enhancing protease
MQVSPFTRCIAGVTVFALVAACATTDLPPISAAGQAFEPLADEATLWQRAREEEKELLTEVRLYDDPLLEDYLHGLVGRLNPPGMAANPEIRYRVRVVEDPTLNAFAYPHGSLYIHTGLLARLETEAQLATVLGHEMTHVENRHMLRFQRSARNRQIGFTIAAVAAAVVLTHEAAEAYSRGQWGRGATIEVLSDIILALGLQLAFLASVNGYGRSLEQEADMGGFHKLEAAGYDLAQASRVYELLLDDHGEPKKMEAFFFGSHPRLTERIENARSYAAARPEAHPVTHEEEPEAEAGDEAFLRRIRPVVRDDARLNLELGRLVLAESQLERARAWMPEDPEVFFLTGRLRLAQADGRADEEGTALREEAEAAFRETLAWAPDHTGALRELGLLLYQRQDFEGACVAFREYVAVASQAGDVGRIRDYLRELQWEGRCP